jgi:hypothetical protein
MTFYYTARKAFDKTCENEVMSWKEYIAWSGLTHLTELVSLDGMLNAVLVKPDRNNAEEWPFIHIVNLYETGFFTTLDYVLRRMSQQDKFNLLRVVLEPDRDCKDVPLDDYEFVGYELLDQDFHTSALTNCGGFDETFSVGDLNGKGLIDDFTKAYTIKKQLLANNPEEYHADTNVIAVWRHKTIGR